MGMKLKSELGNKNEAPGPGQYTGDTQSIKQSAPKFGFGSSSRPGLAKNDVPGPGQYYIPVKVADVPDYSLPNRPMPEFKVV